MFRCSYSQVVLFTAQYHTHMDTGTRSFPVLGVLWMFLLLFFTASSDVQKNVASVILWNGEAGIEEL